MAERYDSIGIGYDNSRKADPWIAQRLFELLTNGQSNGIYLDLGCGTGNYTSLLEKMGLQLIGVDPSEAMLEKAKAKQTSVTWLKGKAEHIPLGPETVDGVLACLTIHHWNDLKKGFQEIHRVLKDDGNIVIFTTLPEQTAAYWLRHYFPKMIEQSATSLPYARDIENAFSQAGLRIIYQEPYFVRPDLQDRFLNSGKYKPELYLDAKMRKSISSFSLIANQEEVKKGLKDLESDIATGRVREVIQRHENDLGDYLFIAGKK